MGEAKSESNKKRKFSSKEDSMSQTDTIGFKAIPKRDLSEKSSKNNSKSSKKSKIEAPPEEAKRKGENDGESESKSKSKSNKDKSLVKGSKKEKKDSKSGRSKKEKKEKKDKTKSKEKKSKVKDSKSKKQPREEPSIDEATLKKPSNSTPPTKSDNFHQLSTQENKTQEKKAQPRSQPQQQTQQSRWNNWESSELGSEDRKNKFLRLMGAKKLTASSFSYNSETKESIKTQKSKQPALPTTSTVCFNGASANADPSALSHKKINQDLERQFQQGLSTQKMKRSGRAVGLGFS